MADLDGFERVDVHDEKLIAQVMNYLKYVDADNSTRDDAMPFLELMQTADREIATRVSVDNFDTYYEAFKDRHA